MRVKRYGCGHEAEWTPGVDPEPPMKCPLCSKYRVDEPVSNITEVKALATPRRTPGVMNKTESRYAQYLDSQLAAGLICNWWFEKLAVRIGERGFWHPDFLVHFSTGLLELHDTKGFVEDDALVKAKAAAEMLPFGVVHVSWVKGSWKFRRIGR